MAAYAYFAAVLSFFGTPSKLVGHRTEFSQTLPHVRKLFIIITSHHMEKTEAGLKGLYIREITTVIDLLICYY